jgi:hypothetical protein
MPAWMHSALTAIHIAGGLLAIFAGAAAAAARKGGPLHARAGTGFVAAMLLLGITAAILEPYRPVPGSPINGIIVCYFVATAWAAARRRDGTAGRFEMAAGATALTMSALVAWSALTGATTPNGTGPVFVFAGLLLIGGLGDLNAVLRRRLEPSQRVARHLWRMCFAFFIATGSFFLGQQDVMPAAVRGSAWLFLPALAPLALMLFWLVRIRLPKVKARLKLRAADLELQRRTRQPSA